MVDMKYKCVSCDNVTKKVGLCQQCAGVVWTRKGAKPRKR